MLTNNVSAINIRSNRDYKPQYVQNRSGMNISTVGFGTIKVLCVSDLTKALPNGKMQLFRLGNGEKVLCMPNGDIRALTFDEYIKLAKEASNVSSGSPERTLEQVVATVGILPRER